MMLTVTGTFAPRFVLSRTKGKPFHGGAPPGRFIRPATLLRNVQRHRFIHTLSYPLLLHRVAEGGGVSDIAPPPKIQSDPLPYREETAIRTSSFRFRRPSRGPCFL